MTTHHICDDDLEAYALDRLADAAPIEEHLLVCEECRERLADRTATRKPCGRRYVRGDNY